MMIRALTTGHCGLLVLLAVLFLNVGCAGSSFKSAEVRIYEYHSSENLVLIEEFTKRLYAKNPKYEEIPAERSRKLRSIFEHDSPTGKFAEQASYELLTAAFGSETEEKDRVYLLGLGLAKSIREAYGLDKGTMIISGLQIDLERLERLHHNISQVNWRLKTYKDNNGELIFLTNAAGDDGYINMGYEVIMTEILTRIKDDIYLRGGLTGQYLFSMSTLFMSIVL
jgi:hypothetical protein